MLAKFGANSGGFTCWSNFDLIQVEPHTIGQIWNQCKWHSISRAGEITQVIDSIPWVRCASGNVCYKCGIVHRYLQYYWKLLNSSKALLSSFHYFERGVSWGKPVPSKMDEFMEIVETTFDPPPCRENVSQIFAEIHNQNFLFITEKICIWNNFLGRSGMNDSKWFPMGIIPHTPWPRSEILWKFIQFGRFILPCVGLITLTSNVCNFSYCNFSNLIIIKGKSYDEKMLHILLVRVTSFYKSCKKAFMSEVIPKKKNRMERL